VQTIGCLSVCAHSLIVKLFEAEKSAVMLQEDSVGFEAVRVHPMPNRTGVRVRDAPHARVSVVGDATS